MFKFTKYNIILTKNIIYYELKENFIKYSFYYIVNNEIYFLAVCYNINIVRKTI